MHSFIHPFAYPSLRVRPPLHTTVRSGLESLDDDDDDHDGYHALTLFNSSFS